ITETLKEDSGKRTALLVLRVEDPMDNAEQPVGKQWRWYTTTSGIWQTVYLEPRSASHIRSFRIITEIEAGTARFDIQCAHTGKDCDIEIAVSPPNSPRQASVIPVHEDAANQTIKLSPVALWDPNTPNLYQATLCLKRQQEVLDTIWTYFGMRKIDFELA